MALTVKAIYKCLEELIEQGKEDYLFIIDNKLPFNFIADLSPKKIIYLSSYENHNSYYTSNTQSDENKPITLREAEKIFKDYFRLNNMEERDVSVN